jgi:hypothetical protein
MHISLFCICQKDSHVILHFLHIVLLIILRILEIILHILNMD